MYIFCIDIPYENTLMYFYDNLDELKNELESHMKKYDDWFIIKGDIINL